MLFINAKEKQLVSWRGGCLFFLLEFFFLNLAKTSQKTSSKLVSIMSKHEKVWKRRFLLVPVIVKMLTLEASNDAPSLIFQKIISH